MPYVAEPNMEARQEAIRGIAKFIWDEVRGGTKNFGGANFDGIFAQGRGP